MDGGIRRLRQCREVDAELAALLRPAVHLHPPAHQLRQLAHRAQPDAAALDDYTRNAVVSLGTSGYRAFAGQRDDGFYADVQSIFDLDFSFSGLKTSVMNYVRKHPDVSTADVAAFEASVLKEAGMSFAPVPPRYHSPYFAHVFAGGYESGYYAYIWSEVLARDSGAWFHAHGGLTRTALDVVLVIESAAAWLPANVTRVGTLEVNAQPVVIARVPATTEAGFPRDAFEALNPAFIRFSSGTTGKSKGMLIGLAPIKFA